MSTISGGIPLFTPRSGGGSGGGGGPRVDWTEQANFAEYAFVANIPCRVFSNGLDQQLYCVINIPSTYEAGQQALMRVKIFNEDTSGDILIRTTAILVRAEVDEYDSTTNTHVSTNAAITMSAANDREPQKVTLDLSDASGLINSVAISAGDMIVLRIYRATDTATGDLNLIVGSEEVTFE
jgi:hypothetical protein